MLILTRKSNQSIAIGDDIVLTVLEIRGGQVKIGIKAPKNLQVHRHEVYEKIMTENLSCSMVDRSLLSGIEILLDGGDK